MIFFKLIMQHCVRIFVLTKSPCSLNWTNNVWWEMYVFRFLCYIS